MSGNEIRYLDAIEGDQTGFVLGPACVWSHLLVAHRVYIMYVPSYWHLVGRLYVVLETSYTYNSLSECFDRHNSSQFTTMYRIARPHSHHTHNNINASSLRQLFRRSQLWQFCLSCTFLLRIMWKRYCGVITTSACVACSRPTLINVTGRQASICCSSIQLRSKQPLVVVTR